MVCFEELFQSLYGQILNEVRVLLAAVVAFSRIAFRIFAVQDAGHRFQHRQAAIVLGGDHLEASPLALELAGYRISYLLVYLKKRGIVHATPNINSSARV